MENSIKRIFISRNQNDDSVFYKTLTKHGFDVHGESLINITPFPFDSVPEADWIFFYSKNGVKYFFEQLNNEIIFKNKFATIGFGTAEYLVTHAPAIHCFNRGQLPLSFIGDGKAQTTAKAFLKIAKGKKILFPRAKNSQRSVQLILGNKVEAIDLIVYNNIPKKTFDLPEFYILVFTSPLNAKAYFSVKKINDNQLIIAIGNTTAAALNKFGIKKIKIAENPSEEALAKIILTHLSINNY